MLFRSLFRFQRTRVKGIGGHFPPETTRAGSAESVPSKSPLWPSLPGEQPKGAPAPARLRAPAQEPGAWHGQRSSPGLASGKRGRRPWAGGGGERLREARQPGVARSAVSVRARPAGASEAGGNREARPRRRGSLSVFRHPSAGTAEPGCQSCPAWHDKGTVGYSGKAWPEPAGFWEPEGCGVLPTGRLFLPSVSRDPNGGPFSVSLASSVGRASDF